MSKILIVDDDVELADQVRRWLAFEKFTIELSHDADEALELMRISTFDIIILDWNLGNKATGLDLLKSFRGQGGRTPILMLTGRNEIQHKEEGFYSGADDYLTKPFDLKELSARIKALLRRPQTFVGNALSLQGITLDNAANQVTINNTQVQLLPKEFALLELFMRNPNRVFSPDALLSHVWKSDTESSIDTVRTYVKTLRKKISAAGGPSALKTVHGVGYKFED